MANYIQVNLRERSLEDVQALQILISEENGQLAQSPTRICSDALAVYRRIKEKQKTQRVKSDGIISHLAERVNYEQ